MFRFRRLTIGTVTLTAATIGYSAYDPVFRLYLPFNTDAFFRQLRTSYNVLLTAIDYKINVLNRHDIDFLDTQNDKNSEEYLSYRHDLRECNLRAAKRLYKVCKSHGGIYNKFAQYVSTMNNVLPKEVIEIIAPLQDKAKQISKEESVAAIKAELATLGHDFDTLFVEFDEEAIAAASLAQVHRAVMKINGENKEVALKIQYPRLKRQTDGDVSTIKLLTNIIGRIFPKFEYTWLVPEFEGNLTLELDFEQEAKNGLRLKSLFADRKDVYVPDVYTDFSTEKLLVMEFIKGWKVDDRAQTIANKVHPERVARTVSTIFGDMIHVHGFVHCDPHAGNLLLRKITPEPLSFSNVFPMLISLAAIPVFLNIGYFDFAAVSTVVSGVTFLYQTYTRPALEDFGKNFELVILDHGMYRRLEPEFRRNYCLLWKALLTRDQKMGAEVVQKLGIGFRPSDYEAFSLSLTYRTPGSRFSTGGRMTREQIKELREKYQNVSLQEVNDFLRKLPRDLLFVMRSTNIVRSLNKALGGTSRQRFKVMGESAVRGLALSETSHVEENLLHFQEVLSKYEKEHQDILAIKPYRVNLPVESEILKDRRRQFYEDFEILKLRSYIEILDFFADLMTLYGRNLSEERIDPEQLSLES